MCAIPALCSSPEFMLRGPITSPPVNGWRIRTLPAIASELQNAWASYPSQPQNSKEAWQDMLEFLKANGVIGKGITYEVMAISEAQWCGDEPARCRGLKRRKASEAVYLPWAKDVWEQSNYKLHDDAGFPGLILASIVRTLTTLIRGPEGCPKCAIHWDLVLSQHPVPQDPTLHEARVWLVDRHNDTRTGKVPTPFSTVAAKFNWTTP
jgi:hypothetical protein